MFITPASVQKEMADNARTRRLQMDLTQAGLAKRSGVPLPTLRKFEQTGAISLRAFLKIQMVLGGLEGVLKATQVQGVAFTSIDDVLQVTKSSKRKRGKRND